MNDNSLDDELDLGNEKSSAGWKKIAVIGLGVALLLGLGGGLTYFLLAPSEEQGSEETTPAEEAVVEEKGPAIYHDLKPVFVVNLSPGGKARMLQIGIQALTRSEAVVEFLKHNDPMVRHNLLKLFGSLKSTDLEGRAGKEKLQADVLAELRRIIKEQGGPGSVEGVYFTNFVMQ